MSLLTESERALADKAGSDAAKVQLMRSVLLDLAIGAELMLSVPGSNPHSAFNRYARQVLERAREGLEFAK